MSVNLRGIEPDLTRVEQKEKLQIILLELFLSVNNFGDLAGLYLETVLGEHGGDKYGLEDYFTIR